MIELPNVDIVAVDVEASGLHPDSGARVSCVGLAWEGGSVGLPFGQGEETLLGRREDLGGRAWEALLDWLEGRRLVAHGAKYDLTMLRVGTERWKGRDLLENLEWCTMLGAWDEEPLQSKGLDAAARRAGLGGKLEGVSVKGGRADLLPWSEIEGYVVRDAELCWGLFQRQRKRGLTRRLARELELLKVLARMEERGLGYDAEESLEIAERLEARAAGLEGRLPFRATVNGAKSWFGEKVQKRTAKGAASLDGEELRRLVAEGVEWAAEWAEWSYLQRAVAMWFRGYPEKLGADGRLRCVYRQAAAKNARLTVERVQLQALPHEARLGWLRGEKGPRELVRVREGAEEGVALWNLDLQQAELRVAAKYARCESMVRALTEGEDLHGRVCERVMGVEKGKVEAREWKWKRDVAKRLNFASGFGVGAERFQAELRKWTGVELEVGECARLLGEWRKEYPEFGDAGRKAERIAKRKGRVKLLAGTEWEVESEIERGLEHTAWSRIVAGSLAECLKLWLIEAERGVGGVMVLSVHDSIVVEGSEEEARRIAEIGELTGEECFGLPMPVDLEAW